MRLSSWENFGSRCIPRFLTASLSDLVREKVHPVIRSRSKAKLSYHFPSFFYHNKTTTTMSPYTNSLAALPPRCNLSRRRKATSTIPYLDGCHCSEQDPTAVTSLVLQQEQYSFPQTTQMDEDNMLEDFDENRILYIRPDGSVSLSPMFRDEPSPTTKKARDQQYRTPHETNDPDHFPRMKRGNVSSDERYPLLSNYLPLRKKPRQTPSSPSHKSKFVRPVMSLPKN